MLASWEPVLLQETACPEEVSLHGAASLSMKSGEQIWDGRITGCVPLRSENSEQWQDEGQHRVGLDSELGGTVRACTTRSSGNGNSS